MRRCVRQSSPSAADTPLRPISAAADSSMRVRRNPSGRCARIGRMTARSEITAIRRGPMRMGNAGPKRRAQSSSVRWSRSSRIWSGLASTGDPARPGRSRSGVRVPSGRQAGRAAMRAARRRTSLCRHRLASASALTARSASASSSAHASEQVFSVRFASMGAKHTGHARSAPDASPVASVACGSVVGWPTSPRVPPRRSLRESRPGRHRAG